MLIQFYAKEVRTMTIKKRLEKTRINFDELTSGQICFGLLGIFCLLLILRNSSVAVEYMSRGLLLCARTVIPSLFPFMVLSELIVTGGIGRKILGKICKPFCKLFRLTSEGCMAVLLGMLCGFPIGARCAIISFEQGQISREEAERVLCFSNNPSSAFLISAVGGSLWENPKFGLALYLSVLTASALTGIFLGRHSKKRGKANIHTPLPHPTSTSGAQLFSEAMHSATISMLLVCAYVIFFSALVGTFNFMPGVQKLPEAMRALFFCVFEMSSGMSQASTLASPMIAAILCAFAAGWSGISVHCQILAICDKKNLSLRPYVRSKLIQSILTPLIFAILLTISPELLIPAVRA